MCCVDCACDVLSICFVSYVETAQLTETSVSHVYLKSWLSWCVLECCCRPECWRQSTRRDSTSVNNTVRNCSKTSIPWLTATPPPAYIHARTSMFVFFCPPTNENVDGLIPVLLAFATIHFNSYSFNVEVDITQLQTGREARKEGRIICCCDLCAAISTQRISTKNIDDSLH